MIKLQEKYIYYVTYGIGILYLNIQKHVFDIIYWNRPNKLLIFNCKKFIKFKFILNQFILILID